MNTIIDPQIRLEGSAPWLSAPFNLADGKAAVITAYGMGEEDSFCVKHALLRSPEKSIHSSVECFTFKPDEVAIAATAPLIKCEKPICGNAEKPSVRLKMPGAYVLEFQGAGFAARQVTVVVDFVDAVSLSDEYLACPEIDADKVAAVFMRCDGETRHVPNVQLPTCQEVATAVQTAQNNPSPTAVAAVFRNCAGQALSPNERMATCADLAAAANNQVANDIYVSNGAGYIPATNTYNLQLSNGQVVPLDFSQVASQLQQQVVNNIANTSTTRNAVAAVFRDCGGSRLTPDAQLVTCQYLEQWGQARQDLYVLSAAPSSTAGFVTYTRSDGSTFELDVAGALSNVASAFTDCNGNQIPFGTQIVRCDQLNDRIAQYFNNAGNPTGAGIAQDTSYGLVQLNLGNQASDDTNAADALVASGFNSLAEGNNTPTTNYANAANTAINAVQQSIARAITAFVERIQNADSLRFFTGLLDKTLNNTNNALTASNAGLSVQLYESPDNTLSIIDGKLNNSTTPPPNVAKLYVSNDGDDSAVGDRANPLRTLAEAHRRGAPDLNRDIYLHEGQIHDVYGVVHRGGIITHYTYGSQTDALLATSTAPAASQAVFNQAFQNLGTYIRQSTVQKVDAFGDGNGAGYPIGYYQFSREAVADFRGINFITAGDRPTTPIVEQANGSFIVDASAADAVKFDAIVVGYEDELFFVRAEKTGGNWTIVENPNNWASVGGNNFTFSNLPPAYQVFAFTTDANNITSSTQGVRARGDDDVWLTRTPTAIQINPTNNGNETSITVKYFPTGSTTQTTSTINVSGGTWTTTDPNITISGTTATVAFTAINTDYPVRAIAVSASYPNGQTFNAQMLSDPSVPDMNTGYSRFFGTGFNRVKEDVFIGGGAVLLPRAEWQLTSADGLVGGSLTTQNIEPSGQGKLFCGTRPDFTYLFNGAGAAPDMQQADVPNWICAPTLQDVVVTSMQTNLPSSLFSGGGGGNDIYTVTSNDALQPANFGIYVIANTAGNLGGNTLISLNRASGAIQDGETLTFIDAAGFPLDFLVPSGSTITGNGVYNAGAMPAFPAGSTVTLQARQNGSIINWYVMGH